MYRLTDCAFLHVWDVWVCLLQEEEWKEVEEEREKDYSGLRISNLQIQYGFLYIAAYTQWEIHHIVAVMHIEYHMCQLMGSRFSGYILRFVF